MNLTSRQSNRPHQRTGSAALRVPHFNSIRSSATETRRVSVFAISLPPTNTALAKDVSSNLMKQYLSNDSSLRIINMPVEGRNQVSEDRVVGAFLASLAANVLAAPLIADRSYQVPQRFPDGVTSFFAHDIGEVPMRFGQHDGHFSTLLATARSCVTEGGVKSEAIAREIARLGVESSSKTRRYPPYAKLIIDTLNGPQLPLERIPYLAALHLAKTAQASSQITGD